MGHYYAEMMCQRCGKLHCICPPQPDTSLDKWVIDSDYTPIKARDWEEKHKNDKGWSLSAHTRRLFMKHFNTKKEAKAAAAEQLNLMIESMEEQITKLRALRKSEPK